MKKNLLVLLGALALLHIGCTAPIQSDVPQPTKGASIIGKILQYGTFTPLSDISVEISSQTSSFFALVKTDSNGHYSLQGLKDKELYYIDVKIPNYRPYHSSPLLLTESEVESVYINLDANPSPEFADCIGWLNAYTIYQEKLPPNPLLFETIPELFATIGDPWTYYIPPDDAKIYLANMGTNETGVGARFNFTNTGIVVANVYRSSPAFHAGLKKNDTIISIDCRLVIGEPTDTLLHWLVGDIGTTKTLEIQRNQSIQKITIILNNYLAPSAIAIPIDSSTLYLQLSMFTDKSDTVGGSTAEIHTFLKENQNATNIIFDLRQNGGGLISECVNIASEFLPSGTTLGNLKMRTFNGPYSYITKDSALASKVGGSAISKRIYLLVDYYTASASELLVSALMCNNPNAISIGTRTYGKGRGQILGETADSGLVKITSLLITPTCGNNYDMKGIEPNRPLQSGEDALTVALSMIRGQNSLAKIKTDILIPQPVKKKSWEPLSVIRNNSLNINSKTY